MSFCMQSLSRVGVNIDSIIPLHPHVILHEVAESTFSKSEGKLPPMGEGAPQGGWRLGHRVHAYWSPTGRGARSCHSARRACPELQNPYQFWGFPHGFCDFAFGSARNDRMEGMLKKIKMHQTGLELENSESIWFVNHSPKFCGWMRFSL